MDKNLELYLGQDFWFEVGIDLEADYQARQDYWNTLEEMDALFAEWEGEMHATA